MLDLSSGDSKEGVLPWACMTELFRQSTREAAHVVPSLETLAVVADKIARSYVVRLYFEDDQGQGHIERFLITLYTRVLEFSAGFLRYLSSTSIRKSITSLLADWILTGIRTFCQDCRAARRCSTVPKGHRSCTTET
jgi:hypothetical protein